MATSPRHHQRSVQSCTMYENASETDCWRSYRKCYEAANPSSKTMCNRMFWQGQEETLVEQSRALTSSVEASCNSPLIPQDLKPRLSLIPVNVDSIVCSISSLRNFTHARRTHGPSPKGSARKRFDTVTKVDKCFSSLRKWSPR